VAQGSRASNAAFIAGNLSLLAGVVHVWAAPQHFLPWWGYGIFFVVVGVAQLILGLWLLRRPGRSIVLASLVLNAVVVIIYVLSRTWGIPLGPHAGMIQYPGILDMATLGAEIGLIFALTAITEGMTRRIVMNAILVVALALWGLRVSGLLI
jgi:hypothetical protein